MSDTNGPIDEDAAEADLAEARAFQSAGSHTAAMRAAERALARNPVGRYAFDALDVFADVAYARSDYARQAEIAAELLARDPERIEGHLHLAYAHVQSGDNVRAAKAIAAGLERFPTSAYLAQQEARRFAAQGDPKAAVPWAEKAVQWQPTSATHLATLAACLSDADRVNDAQTKIAEALALDPLSSYVQHNAAIIAYDQRRWPDCEAHAAQAAALDPYNTDVRSLAAMARWFKHPLMKPCWQTLAFAAPFMTCHPSAVLVLLFLAHAFFGYFGALFIVPAVIVYFVVCFVVISVAKRRARRPRPLRLKDY